MKTKYHVIVFLCIAFLFTACNNSSELFYKFNHIPRSKWSKENILLFDTDSMPVDANKKYDVFVELSHNTQYPYQNLWLFVKQNLQDNHFNNDTIEIELADIYGKWNGNGSGGLYQISIPYKKAITLTPEKRCSVYVVHGMRDEPITGIEKVGLKIIETRTN